GDDHAEPRIASAGDAGELDAVHRSSEADVGHQEHERGRKLVEHRLRGFRALALDHVVIAFLEQRADHLPLKRVVLHDERRGARGIRLAHWKLPKMDFADLSLVKNESAGWFGSNLRKCGNGAGSLLNLSA